MTIVCATDFSDAAEQAVAVAADIAAKRHERLLLWHGVQPQTPGPVEKYVSSLKADAQIALRERAADLAKRGFVVESEVSIGWPEEELPRQLPPDTTLLVAGARGHSRGTHWLIGTVVERLARVVTVPMLIVRDSASLEAWLTGGAKLNVVAATDFSAVSDFALRRLDVLQSLGEFDLELLYVEYPPADFERLGVSGPIYRHRPHPLVDEVLTRELTSRAEALKTGGSVTTRVARTLGETGSLIALQAEDENAGLIVVGAHQRRALSRIWHGSITHSVLHSAETNVLVIPFHDAEEEARALETVTLSTIVVATDFSPCGDHAVAVACAVARPGTHIVLLNVGATEEERAERSEQLARLREAVSHNGCTMEDVVTTGRDVAATICGTAERIDADLIVIGRHTRSRVAQLFLGTVSGEVLARSRQPVMIVPDPSMF